MHRIPPLTLVLALLALPACQSDPEAPAAPTAQVDPNAPYDVFGARIFGARIFGARIFGARIFGARIFGALITPEGAVPVQQVAAMPADYAGRTVKLEGTVTAVCQMRGCWLTLDTGGGPGVRIVMPREDGDYVFTVPKGISGRTVVVQGTLEETTLDAATQAHLADDAGEEVDAAVLQPRSELQITADAVLVKRA